VNACSFFGAIAPIVGARFFWFAFAKTRIFAPIYERAFFRHLAGSIRHDFFGSLSQKPESLAEFMNER